MLLVPSKMLQADQLALNIMLKKFYLAKINVKLSRSKVIMSDNLKKNDD